MEMPKKWPEKLKALAVECCEPVDNESTVYSAIRLLRTSDDPEHNAKEFTIRQDPDNATESYVWRTA